MEKQNAVLPSIRDGKPAVPPCFVMKNHALFSDNAENAACLLHMRLAGVVLRLFDAHLSAWDALSGSETIRVLFRSAPFLKVYLQPVLLSR